MCNTGKVCYTRYDDAWSAAARCITLGILQDMQVYFCPCRYLHLRTAKVQLHNWFWRRQQPHRVKNWFKQRGMIDQRDNE